MGLAVAAHSGASLSAMWDALRARAYTYAETDYANPHALTAFFNGAATTRYDYDAIGNLGTTTGAATSTYMWDYKNRMLRAWVSGATSTYQYDHTIARMALRTATGRTTRPSSTPSTTPALQRHRNDHVRIRCNRQARDQNWRVNEHLHGDNGSYAPGSVRRLREHTYFP